MTTGIPQRKYYVILFVMLVLGGLSLALVINYTRAHDREILKNQAEEIARVSNRFDYRSCVRINTLADVIHTILEGAVAQPIDPPVTPQDIAYLELLQSYIDGRELEPRNCLAILKERK